MTEPRASRREQMFHVQLLPPIGVMVMEIAAQGGKGENAGVLTVETANLRALIVKLEKEAKALGI